MIQNKVLVRAGRFQGGKLPYVNYVGQIKPADMSKIIWWGDFGNDGTGDGSISAPFLTFGAALDAFATNTHKWILKTDLSVYGEATAGQYVDDAADRVYLDPTKANDSGDGLTAATAKKTYAAAAAVLVSSGRSAIHCVGSFSLADVISQPTQGEIGESLTLSAAPSYSATETLSVTNSRFVGGIRTPAGTLIIIGVNLSSGTLIYRSTDGVNWTSIAAPSYWSTSRYPTGICYGAGKVVISGIGFPTSDDVLYSTDDGLSFSISGSIGHSASWKGICYTGTNFVLYNTDTSPPNRVYYSPDLTTWTAVAPGYSAGWNIFSIASDGAGKVLMVGRKSGTTALLLYSTDHGATWTDISSTTGFGVGANTGGYICIDVGYRDGYWYVLQDTIATAYYYSTSPSTLWTGVTDTLPLPFVNNPSSHFSWSGNKGGLIIAGTDTLGNEIGILNNSGYTVLTTAFGGYYDNLGSLVAGSGASEVICIFGQDSGGKGVVESFLAESANIRANVTNAKTSSSTLAKLAPSVKCENITAQPTTGKAVVSFSGAKMVCSKIISADDTAISHSGNFFSVKRCVISGLLPASITATAAASGDVELLQSVFAGGVNLTNTAGTDKEIIQDCIIQGNFSAAELVTVKANVSGSLVNSTSQSIVSTIPPIFVDTTDYFLSRIALGQAVDSPLINRSAYFSYIYNAATYKDDFGPYRAFTALVQTVFREAFLLPRFGGNALSEDVENVAALLKSIRGKPDVSNRPQGRLDYLSWQSKSINSEVRRFVSYMEKLTDLTVYLDYDFDGQAPGAITINGAHSAGTFEINIQPLDIPVGTVVSLFGKSQIVTQRYPRAGAATKLVLDDVLGGGLSDAQSVEITYIQGAGEFVYVPNRPRKNLRIFSRKKDAYSGMVYTFVRKAE